MVRLQYIVKQNMEVQEMKTEQTKGYLMVIAAGILWGTVGMFTTMLGQYGLASGQIAFLRLAGGTVILGIALAMMKGKAAFRIDRKGLFFCLIMGILSQALFNLAYTRAIQFTDMALAAVLLYTSPVFVCMMSRIFFHEHIGQGKAIALAVNITGCILAVAGQGSGNTTLSLSGILFGIAAGFLYALLTIMGKAALDQYDPLTVLFYGFLFGSLFLGAAVQPWNIRINSPDLILAGAVIGYCIIPTMLAYSIYMLGLSKNLEASRVPVAASVETAAAAIFGTIVLGQSCGVLRVVGIMMVFTSIIMMNSSLRLPRRIPHGRLSVKVRR